MVFCCLLISIAVKEIKGSHSRKSPEVVSEYLLRFMCHLSPRIGKIEQNAAFSRGIFFKAS